MKIFYDGVSGQTSTVSQPFVFVCGAWLKLLFGLHSCDTTSDHWANWRAGRTAVPYSALIINPLCRLCHPAADFILMKIRRWEGGAAKDDEQDQGDANRRRRRRPHPPS